MKSIDTFVVNKIKEKKDGRVFFDWPAGFLTRLQVNMSDRVRPL